MASILELAFERKITVEHVVLWLLSKGKDSRLPEEIIQHNKIRQEFIPYFLNYLRDQTLHLLQNSKSFNSPSKTPSSNNNNTNRAVKKSNTGSSKRTQLFAASPLESSSNKDLCSPILSPHNGNESPVFRGSADRGKRSDHKGGYQNKHNSPAGTPDPNRSKYKLCLGEYMMSPDPTQRRKSGCKETPDSSPRLSPAETKNKHSGKKRATLYPVGKGTGGSKESSPVFRLSDNDFPPVAKTSQRSDETPKPKRRINPTQLLPDGKKYAVAKFQKFAEVVEKTENNIPSRSQSDSAISTIDNDNICLADERELLRKEKAKRQTSNNEIVSSPVNKSVASLLTPSKSSVERQSSISSNSEFVLAKMESVTYTEKLDIIAELYSRCLDEHLFPNISVELYFLTQLLTSLSEEIKTESKTINEDLEDVSLFLTVHNAVYFSVSVLKKQLRLLKYLDKSVVKLLAENKRIVDFSPALQNDLMKLYEQSSFIKSSAFCPRSSIGGVSFQADTDNRKNFPNDRLFHLFKKQRDMFYELIREWEEKRLSNGWSVSDMLGDRIRYLINVKTDLANHLHFGRLFLSQLISMCKGDGTIRTDDDDDNIALLAHLKKTNPEKFKRLQERFIQPFSVGGPCPPSSFPGNQEFFREFILCASSPVFNQHLSNIFTAKIKKLNNTEFCQKASAENQEAEGINQDQHQLFASCLLTLRLLGKFLGFVTFLPYQATDSLPDSIQSNYIELRNNQPHPLDVLELIHLALATRRLTLTIPWIIEYLSMMDKTAPLLHYYQLVLFKLQYIHKLSWEKVGGSNYEFGYMLLVAMLGWLFESPVMPQGIFLMELSNDITQFKTAEATLIPLDNLELVNRELLYTVCPYIGEMRTLLVEFAVGASSRPTIRKITPVAADDLPEPDTSTNIQTQLEENFFHNHPSSLKRTVEFVSERTASNFIKHFRATDLLVSIEESRSRLNKLLISSGTSPTTELKDKSQIEFKKLAQTVCEEIRKKVSDSKREYCLNRVKAALQLLLPDEQTPAVVTMAANISCRMTEERIKHWMNNHITTSMYLKEVNAEADRLYKKELLNKSPNKQTSQIEDGTIALVQTPGVVPSLPSSTIASEHREDVMPLSELLINFMRISRELTVRGNCNIDSTRLLMLLNTAHLVVLYKQDTLPQSIRSLAQIILDLCLTVVCCKPDLFTSDYIDVCKLLWTTDLKHHTIFSTVSSIRWHHMLYHSSNKQISRKKYISFIIMLLEEELISPQLYENGCLKVLKNSFIYHDYIEENLCDIVHYFNSSSEKKLNVDFTETLEWIKLNKDDKLCVNDKLANLVIES
ncbi:hypothetical protein SNE40_009036 [Patella caerulea]|uniref:Codanin-1 C-terminal domain-containing protein n=1 Tax=Patella caerulea TaxID=87958 RepID=A0AAN8JRI8_PATCE